MRRERPDAKHEVAEELPRLHEHRRVNPGALLTSARPNIGGSHRRFPVPVTSSPYGLTAIICNSIRAPAFNAATCTVALAGGFVGKDSLYTALNFAKSSKLVM